MVSQIKLGDIAVDVVLKDIKNVHLSVHPPSGRVRIAAPEHMNLDTIRVFAVSKLAWIQKQQKNFESRIARLFESISIGKVTMFGESATCSGLSKWTGHRPWD